MKWLDRWLGRLSAAFLPAPARQAVNNPASFLVIRPGGIGDAVLLIPALHLLRSRFPQARIDILAEKRNGAIFRLCSGINEIFLYDRLGGLRRVFQGRYDVVIDSEQWHRLSAVVARLTGAAMTVGFATSDRKRLFTHPLPYSHGDYELDSFLSLLAPFGIDRKRPSGPFLEIPAAAKARAKDLLGDYYGQRFVALFPGASIAERRWGAEKYGELSARLHQQGIPVVVIGGPEDRMEAERIASRARVLNLTGLTSLVESAAVIDQATVLVSGDSGILHMGVGLDKSSVSLFGPGIAKKWAPRGDKHVVLDHGLPCSPCTKFGYTPPCPRNMQCIQRISVEEVEMGVKRLLEIGLQEKTKGK
ncbi:MAG: glycosyltransferase family 9 protein [Thermodesulfobacteriota bacterium]